MIRVAKFADILAIIALFKEGHLRSKFSATASVDERGLQKYLMSLIKNHGSKCCEGTWCLVGENNGRLTAVGFFIQQPVQLMANEWEAMDLFFMASPQAHPNTARELLKSFHRWAEANPRIIRTHVGVTDVVQDWRPIARMYERLGYRQTGALMERPIERKRGAANAA